MGTVDKQIADRIIAGEFADEDGWPIRIIEYDNAFGGKSYGVEHNFMEYGRYVESNFVRNPRIYWERKRGDAK